MINWRIILAFFPLLSFAQTWSLDQCIDSAIQNNINLKQSVLKTQISEVTLQNSKQNLLPSINASAVHGYNWGQTIDPFTNQFATNRVQYDNFYLSSSFVLFSGLQNYYTIKANNYSSKQSQLASEIAERNLKMEISAAFLQVLLNESIEELSESNLELTQKQLDRIIELKNQNQATKFDVSEIDAQFSMDNFQITKARNDVRYSKLLLQQLMNIAETDSFELDKSFQYLNGSTISQTNDSIIMVLPDIVAIELSVEKQLMLLKSTKGRYYPSILLSGSLGSGYSGNNKMIEQDGSFSPKPFGRQLNENFYQSAQIILSIPIFNKNSIRNQVKISQFQLQSMYLDKENEYNQLKQKLEQLSMDIINESEQYSALQKVHESATLNHQNFKIRFEQGDVTYNQLIEVQNKLFNATSRLIQSEYQLKFKSSVMGFYYE